MNKESTTSTVECGDFIFEGRPLIGFCGQGWIGKNYADDFERRGYYVVRYSLEKQYIKNKKETDTINTSIRMIIMTLFRFLFDVFSSLIIGDELLKIK